jgi:hypothetical protein
MALVVEEDEAANPVDVRLLGSDGIVPQADRVAELIEQTPGRIG